MHEENIVSPRFVTIRSPNKLMVQRVITSEERGATIIESVLIFPLLLILIFAIVELSRYWGVRGVVSQGAQRGLDLAIKIPHLEFEQSSNNSNPNCINDITTCDGYSDFIQSRTEVIELAGQLPQNALVGSSYQGDTTRFVGFGRVSVMRAGAIVLETVPAMLLRPSECRTDIAGTLHCHPTVCPIDEPERSACLAMHLGARVRQPLDSMEELLKVEPIVVAMPVRFKTMLPVPSLSTFFPLGLAGGYREIISTGSYPIPVELPPPPPPPLATATATPTEVPGAPTRTPVSTATTAPSPTATPSPIPCVPACSDAGIVDNCGRLYDKQCARCVSGHCLCTNNCSSTG